MSTKIKTFVILVVLVFLVIAGYAIYINWLILTETFFKFPLDYLFWFICGIAITLLTFFISSRIGFCKEEDDEEELDESEDDDD